MFTIKIADLYIKIDNRFEYVERFCSDYICAEDRCTDPDISVSITDEDLRYEAEISENDFAPDTLEVIAVYRRICGGITKYDAFFMHSSVVAVDGLAYAFAAKSGTGKSTHTSLWLEYFGKRAFIVNGDKPIFRFIDGELRAYGTPWCGKEGLNTNTSAPLKAICFIEQSDKNVIRTAAQAKIPERLFRQLLVPRDAQTLSDFLELIDRTIRTIPMYVLKCNISPEAVETACGAMMKGFDKIR